MAEPDSLPPKADTVARAATTSVESVSRIGSSIEPAATTQDDDCKSAVHEFIRVPVSHLGRSSWRIILVSIYAAAAICSWVIICIQTFRPITTAHYESFFKHTAWTYDMHSFYEKNERWFQAARVVQAIVAVLTLPMTTAVCSKAAVLIAQGPSKGRSMSLRKTVILANKGWSDLSVYYRLLTGRWRRYGSPFLYFAIALTVVGGVIAPLQSVFLKNTTVKAPSKLQVMIWMTDIVDLFQTELVEPEDNLVVTLSRAVLTSTTRMDPQPRLWTETSSACNATTNNRSPQLSDTISPCTGGASLANLSELAHPFSAQLPAGFNTGLVTQYLPRVNSSATRDEISASQFPSECVSLPGAFYAHIHQPASWDDGLNGTFTAQNYGDWSIVACMPSNQTFSPWKATGDRQDISEELYLNISTADVNYGSYNVLFKVPLNSTLGYFMLPNYKNGQNIGSVLQQSPFDSPCPGSDIHSCKPEPYYGSPSAAGTYYRRDVTQVHDSEFNTSEPATELATTRNKGPLLVTAMALFGEGSFIATHANLSTPNQAGNQDYICVDRAPFTGLLISAAQPERTNDSTPGAFLYHAECFTRDDYDPSFLQDRLRLWAMAFATGFPSSEIVNAFNAAAFLVNEVWLANPLTNPVLGSSVYYDLGIDTQKPVISDVGIVLVSLLMFVYLACMLLLAVYIYRSRSWTEQLDAFAMMQIGAAISDRLPFDYVPDLDKVEVLDEMPAWIGDATEGAGRVSELGLGALTPLARERRVRCFENT